MIAPRSSPARHAAAHGPLAGDSPGQHARTRPAERSPATRAPLAPARPRLAAGARLFGLTLALACGSEATAPEAAPAAPPPPAPAAPSEPPAPAPGESFAKPKLIPPPPPEGAALLPDDKAPVYVQRCDEAHPCPDLLQPAGETHCRNLELGGLAHWRLPDRAEVKRFGEIADLERADGFHWTRTAFAEDAAQAWIVDPKSGQETTIPRGRKPFRVRCVFEP